MAKKKTNIISINLSDKAWSVLMAMGLYDEKKHAKTMGMSRFISNLIIEWAGNRPFELRKKMVILSLQEITKERNSLDLSIEKLAKELESMKE